ncbi:hypothetical protein C900_05715 [Fulvivirga imtechensis AK7]|uniref:Uncharacterized protein n=1 Tax=Fulvivirga imtechensis AK7 TaxID=1237149 RepID=L8JWB1_9BACT|nr:hypothetical protein C900_05715 [Fulvivirga imtechensis AK7]
MGKKVELNGLKSVMLVPESEYFRDEHNADMGVFLQTLI